MIEKFMFREIPREYKHIFVDGLNKKRLKCLGHSIVSINEPWRMREIWVHGASRRLLRWKRVNALVFFQQIDWWDLNWDKVSKMGIPYQFSFKYVTREVGNDFKLKTGRNTKLQIIMSRCTYFSLSLSL